MKKCNLTSLKFKTTGLDKENTSNSHAYFFPPSREQSKMAAKGFFNGFLSLKRKKVKRRQYQQNFGRMK